MAEPHTLDRVERFNRTLKEQVLQGRLFRHLEDVRQAVTEFRDRYNRQWCLEKLGFLSPLEARQSSALRKATCAANQCPQDYGRYTTKKCVEQCPYKKPMYRGTTRVSEKCIACYPRIEGKDPLTGGEPMETRCMAACVGKIRLQSLVRIGEDGLWAEDRWHPLYFAIRVEPVARTLYEDGARTTWRSSLLLVGGSLA